MQQRRRQHDRYEREECGRRRHNGHSSADAKRMEEGDVTESSQNTRDECPHHACLSLVPTFA